MFIAMNRFLIKTPHADAFEERWRKRESFLHEFPGFVRFMLLRTAPQDNEVTEFVSHSQWLSREGFEDWLQSDRSRTSHGQSPIPREAFQGPPEFRGYAVALESSITHRTDYRSTRMDERVESAFSRESDLQKKIVERSVEAKLPPIQVGAFEGRLIEILLRSSGARRGVEIGTLGGYSTSWLARAVGPQGRIITIEKDAVRAELARENLRLAGFEENVEVRTGAARDVLKNLEDLKDLDFVFMDADKQGYGEYTRWAIPRLRKGGLLLADNAYLWGGMYYFGESEKKPPFPKEGLHGYSADEFKGMSDCWEQLRSHPEVASLILPTGEGLGIAVKI